MGQEKDKSFQGSLGAIFQTFDGKNVYPTVEEKAAHLLYFVTKNHCFVDGKSGDEPGNKNRTIFH